MTVKQLVEVLGENANKVKTCFTKTGNYAKYCRPFDKKGNSFVLHACQGNRTIITSGFGSFVLPLEDWIDSYKALPSEQMEQEALFIAVEMRVDMHATVYYKVDESYLSKYGPLPKSLAEGKLAPFYVIPLIEFDRKDLFSII